MSVLDRKVVRDIWSYRGQVITIALLIAAGVAVLVGSASNFLSLVAARNTFYEETRFADVFANLTRAPDSLRERIAEIPGVATIETRIVKDVRLVWPLSSISVSGRIQSLPVHGQETLNALILVDGRWPDPSRRDEILVHVAFAETWGLEPGDDLTAILNGRQQTFEIVGIVHSPEYIYATRPGLPFPDDRTFVALWANEVGLASAFDMGAAFNDVVLKLSPGASAAEVIARLDQLLLRYGGTGAYDRSDQPSNRFLEDELAEQETSAIVSPLIFFAIAGFLLNIVLGRLVEAQREQIAALKALGFPSLPIGFHYLKFTAVIWLLGALLGLLLGIWFGIATLAAYRPFFRFPELPQVMPAWLPAAAFAASFAVAATGVIGAIRRVLRLEPAVALRPAVPIAFSRILVRARVGSARVPPSVMIVVRGMLGRPVRTILTIVGIALALPLIVMGLFWWDALDTMERLQFEQIERSDAVVTFDQPKPLGALLELESLPGVLAVEGYRSVPVRLSAGPRQYRLALTGMPIGAELYAPRDADMARIVPARDGLTISRRLAETLGVAVGDSLEVEVLVGDRPKGSLPVVALVDDILGLSAIIEIGTLNRFLHEADLFSEARLRIDPGLAVSTWQRLGKLPDVGTTTAKSIWRAVFDEKIVGLLLVAAVILTVFGLIIAVGVVYNSARIAFHERAWELASLRILGFRRNEVLRILLAELAIETLLAVPLGLVVAKWVISFLLGLRGNESFSIPATISPQTFAMATLVIIGTGAVSSLIVRRKIDRFDLAAALKVRD